MRAADRAQTLSLPAPKPAIYIAPIPTTAAEMAKPTEPERERAVLRGRLQEPRLNQVFETASTARGFGEVLPKASNATAKGRQQNRLVEIVVFGGIVESPSSGDAAMNR